MKNQKNPKFSKNGQNFAGKLPKKKSPPVCAAPAVAGAARAGRKVLDNGTSRALE